MGDSVAPRKPRRHRSQIISVRLSPAEREEIEEGARRGEMSVGGFVRDAALEEARHRAHACLPPPPDLGAPHRVLTEGVDG